MEKRIWIVFLLLALLPFKMKAEWIRLNKSSNPDSPPITTILSEDKNGMTIKIEIPGFELKSKVVDGKTVQTVDLLTDLLTSTPGNPALAFISKVLAIPDQAGISLEIIETDEARVFPNIRISPALKSTIEGQKPQPAFENADVYESAALYPDALAKLDVPSVFRDFRITRLSVFPIRYSPAKQELSVHSSVTVRINYTTDNVVNPKTTAQRPISPAFGKLYRNFITNYQSCLDNMYSGQENGEDIMLCIMPDSYVATFQSYADWKQKSGTKIVITKFSDIGANSTNPTLIKNHITSVYNTWDQPPAYVLLVGDAGVLPYKIINYDYSFAYDNFFVEVEGNDFFPEMMVGRIPNSNDYQLQTMLAKFMKYENNPYVATTSWFKKGLCCSNNEYASQVETKRFAATMMLEGGFTSVDTLMSNGNNMGGGCTMSLADVKNAINNGRSFLNYRGEGWVSGWFANCYNFSVSDVSTLNNGEKLTFLTSIGCGVAQFNASGGNCFGEEWLKLGTPTSGRGAIAFIGPTSNTHTTYNNKIDRGIYMGMFQEGLETPGQALLRGKLNMYNEFGTDPWVEYHYRVFHVLGDPNVHIWKEVPLPITVSHPLILPAGFSQSDIQVNYSLNGNPVKNALVNLFGNNCFYNFYTDSTGKASLDVTVNPGSYAITVRGKDVIPYQGNITVNQYVEYISPDQNPIIDDLNGNSDSLLNPNENGEISFLLKNWGTQNSQNVQATLSILETDFAQVITTSPISYGDILTGASSSGSPFQFAVEPDCPVEQILTLKLHVTSNTGSWDYTFFVKVVGCRLVYLFNLVNDEGSPGYNFRLDPGESAKLVVSIKNEGEDHAQDVEGILICNDPYISLIDSVSIFGTMIIGDIRNNTVDYFMVSVDPACPLNHIADFSVKLFTQNGFYTYLDTIHFSLAIGTPTTMDFTGPDAYGYCAYGSNDTIFEQAPVYDWKEISLIGSNIYIQGNVSDKTTTISIPFGFNYYGVNYNQVRISTDGWIAFGSGSQTNSVNTIIPSNDNVNCMVAGFWDDLFRNDWSETGMIYYYHDVQTHRFIIEWSEVGHQFWPTYPSPTETFQIILLNPLFYPTPTGDGEIIVQYSDARALLSNTVGIENHTQDVGLQYVYNNVYDTTAAYLRSHFAIKFTTQLPGLIVGVGNNQSINGIPPALGQNYPNPFLHETTIPFTIKEAGLIRLEITTLQGALVKVLRNGQTPAGQFSVNWDGKDDQGNNVSPGLYFYQLQTADGTQSKKMFRIE